MARFQALTNAVIDEELELVRERLGLTPSQKAELLREIASLAAWIVRQVDTGRTIEARRGNTVEPLRHPAIERISERTRPELSRIALRDSELRRLAEILDRPFKPTPALRRALTKLANAKRSPPVLQWKKIA